MGKRLPDDFEIAQRLGHASTLAPGGESKVPSFTDDAKEGKKGVVYVGLLYCGADSTVAIALRCSFFVSHASPLLPDLERSFGRVWRLTSLWVSIAASLQVGALSEQFCFAQVICKLAFTHRWHVPRSKFCSRQQGSEQGGSYTWCCVRIRQLSSESNLLLVFPHVFFHSSGQVWISATVKRVRVLQLLRTRLRVSV